MNNENYFVVLTIPIARLIAALGFIFIPFELTERISSEFDEMNDMINQFNWHLFPLTVQKMLPIVVMSTQQTVGFECFGSLHCNRETFEKVN